MRGINQSFPKPLSTRPGAVFVQINGSQVYLGEVEVVVEGGCPCELALPAAIPDKKKESRGNSPITSLKELLHRAPL